MSRTDRYSDDARDAGKIAGTPAADAADRENGDRR